MDLFTLSDNQKRDAPLLGAWHIVGRSGVVGTHAALLHTGQVIFFSRPENPSHRWEAIENGLDNDSSRSNDAADVTLTTIIETTGIKAFEPIAVQVEHNPFCSGHTFLADGRLLVVGGDKKDELNYKTPPNTKYGLDSLRVFIPAKRDEKEYPGEWRYIGKISDSRWYPTCTLLDDGRIFIVSGSIDDQQNFNNQNPTCENIPPLQEGPQFLPLLVEAWPYYSYPFVFVLPSGNLFLFVKDRAHFLRLEASKFARERWVIKYGPDLNKFKQPAKHYPNNATAVLLPLLPDKDYAAKVLIIGGAGDNIYSQYADVNIPGKNHHSYEVDALRDCFILDTSYQDFQSEWKIVKAMEYPRVMPDAVLLPDGKVLVVNGGKKGFAGGDPATGPALPKNPKKIAEEYAVRAAELYDPDENRWQTLALASCSRLYHSTALLLPDGRVLVAGSDHNVNERDWRFLGLGDNEEKRKAPTYEYRIEIFSPPYLFVDNIPRPKILNLPNRIGYGKEFNVEILGHPGIEVKNLKAVLIRPGSVTHNNNMSQRFIGLEIIERASTNLTLKSPRDGKVAPPGYYMLFVLDRGIPSIARFVHLNLEHLDKAVEANLDMHELALWLRADCGILADCYNNVSSWSDISGQCNDVYWHKNIEIGALQRMPKWKQNGLNGHPVIQFTFVSNWQEVWGGYFESKGNPFLPGQNPYVIFVVAHAWPSGPTGKSGIVGWGDFYAPASTNAKVAFSLEPGPRSTDPQDAPPFWFNSIPEDPGKLSVSTVWGNQNKMNYKDAVVPLSQAVLLETSFDGEWCQMRLNNRTLMKEQMKDKNTRDGPLTIGRCGPYIKAEETQEITTGDFFRGDIAEILIYNRRIEDEERMRIQEYLRSRYALW